MAPSLRNLDLVGGNAWVGATLKRNRGALRILGTSLAGSVAFFLAASNFARWVAGKCIHELLLDCCPAATLVCPFSGAPLRATCSSRLRCSIWPGCSMDWLDDCKGSVTARARRKHGSNRQTLSMRMLPGTRAAFSRRTKGSRIMRRLPFHSGFCQKHRPLTSPSEVPDCHPLLSARWAHCPQLFPSQAG